jgi:hypothetical protein
VGPGRMSHMGSPVGETAGAATVAMGVGGLLGALVMTWWLRHRARRTPVAPSDR